MENKMPVPGTEATTNNENKNETKSLPQKEKKEKMSSISKICWALQIIIWIGGFSSFFVDMYEKREYTGYHLTTAGILIVTFESIFYIIYVISELCSPTFDYLIHKRSDVKLVDKMKQLFYSHPRIQFVCECYHYETKYITTYDSKGNSSTTTERRRVVTRYDTRQFYFYSSRDVSGLFRLNYDESSVKDKFYVKLELSKRIDFADDITYSDYKKEKDDFFNLNKDYDDYINFFTEEEIDGFTSYNLINITENNPCGMSCFWFIFFTFLGIVQFYKSYIDSRCIHKSFTIKKLISTRYSLSTEECDIKYKNCDPVISFDEEKVQIPSNEFRCTYNSFKKEIPTQEEIENAKQYSDKVFNIDIDNGDKLNIGHNDIGNNNNINDNGIDFDKNLEQGLIDE